MPPAFPYDASLSLTSNCQTYIYDAPGQLPLATQISRSAVSPPAPPSTPYLYDAPDHPTPVPPSPTAATLSPAPRHTPSSPPPPPQYAVSIAANPINRLDPMGLRTVTLSIVVDKASKPTTFNVSNVQADVNAMFAPALATLTKDKLNIVVTEGSPTSTYYKGVTTPVVGWSYNKPSFWENASGDWISLWNIAAKTYRGCTKQRERYDGFVRFDRGAAVYASTVQNITVVNPTKWEDVAAGMSVKPNWDQAWANMIVHEQIYLGAWGGTDDPGAPAMSIESGHVDFNTPTTITPGWFTKFKKYIGIS